MRGRKVLLLAVKASIGVGLVVWLVRSGRLDLDTLLDVRGGWPLWGLLASQLLMFGAPLVRWALLVRVLDIGIGIGDAVRAGLAGYFVSLVVPAGVGIDGTKMVMLSRRTQGRAQELFSSLVVDRVLGLIALVVIAAVCGGAMLGPRAAELPWGLVAWAAFLLVVGMGVLIWVGTQSGDTQSGDTQSSSRLERLPGGATAKRIAAAAVGFREHPGVLAQAIALSFLGHFGAFASHYFAFHAYGEDASLVAVFAIAPLVNLAWALPVAPMGLGVSDSVAATLYPLVGLEAGAEVVMLVRGIMLLIFALCGAIFLVPSSMSLRDTLEATSSTKDQAALDPPGDVR